MQTAPEMQAYLMQKSAEDPEFRSALLSNPKDTISNEFGISIPDSMAIHVHESDLNSVHIALPPQSELSDEQLEAISAGLCCCL